MDQLLHQIVPISGSPCDGQEVLEKEEEKAEALRRRREALRRKREEMKAHNVLMHDLALVSKQEEKEKVKIQVATTSS